MDRKHSIGAGFMLATTLLEVGCVSVSVPEATPIVSSSVRYPSPTLETTIVPEASGTPLTTATPEASLSDEQIILSDVQRLGIERNQNEINLWRDAYQFDPSVDINTIQDPESESVKRTGDVIKRMLGSHNSSFKHAAEFFLAQKRFIDIIPNMNLTGPIAVNVDINEETRKVAKTELIVSPKFVMIGSNALTLATFITATAKYAEILTQKINSLPPGLSIEEIKRMATGTPEEKSDTSAREWGAGVEAFKIEVGLLGGNIYDPPAVEFRKLASIYIQTGDSPSTPEWRAALEDFLSHHSNQAPGNNS